MLSAFLHLFKLPFPFNLTGAGVHLLERKPNTYIACFYVIYSQKLHF